MKIFNKMALLLTLFGAANAIAQAPWQTQGVVEGNLPASWQTLKAEMHYPHSWLSGHYKDVTQWQTLSRQLFRAALLTPTSTKPFAPEILSKEDRGSYTAEKLALNITDDNRIAALLLMPKSPGPHPAVVLLHDHGSKFDIGKEKLIRPWGDAGKLASAQAWADKFFSGKFIGDELASRGYAVIAIDSPGWGDRGPMVYEQQQALASNYFNLGRSLAGEMAYEDMRTVDFIASYAGVDSQRVGVLGFSMGGFRAWQLAALSDKVAATAVISWFGTYNGLMQPGNNVLRGQSAFYMLHPGMPAQMDIPDIASIAAPKPMLIFSGGQDKLFPQEAVKEAFAKVHRVWKSQHADDKLVTRTWPQLGHVFYREQQDEVFPWLDKWLKP
ncbi:UNVERIFIED_ORG: dienelactone hydrolase [Kosakonia oryzae]|uniref:Dienelactone hydrolase n=2 Tax=Kosakonia radicincitans TaxID=283686 RepID=A0AAX2EVU3_9ENTR|nr:dienelactone hydrolase [Kosakonia oryzae]SFF12943.1 Dienelactone hydrolase [Kosakonia radicincitans]SFR21699.1 Dienelactone hydrolase [Kosakonia radicincitans]SFT97540.1 Dienelactone hydrolase [Kosakonia radicincitans]SFY27667.1 Dienelactone hydrolase [Kosakonia radicincitans]